MAVQNIAYGTYTAMTVTNLQSLANSATAGWQSARVDNTVALADNYEILVSLTTAATAAANDKLIYVYAVPWVYDGTAWHCGADQGTGTSPTGSEGATTIASPNNLILLKPLNYDTTGQTINGYAQLCPTLSADPPDGWSLVIINYTGAALSTGCVVSYRPITYTVA